MSYRKARILKLTKFFLKRMEYLEKIKNLDLNKGFINVDDYGIENRDRNININTLVKDINLNEIIKNLYNTKNYNNIKIILNSIEFKNLEGIKLELKGRLTRRYRADRSLSKIRVKGIFKSSSNLSTVYRGNFFSNLEYSIDISKRRIGAFAIKGWISGK
ncbi:hypothetical protein SPSK_11045 (mitochondrion) [Sporothrix schenckii 1099-18]|uniref:Ribosomal protein S3 n=2 Tax=Sporothrix schenckii TaxID=29908 RepID=A0A0F2LSL6_SPOSC|nr:hypothetical protein SpscM_p01 [Sporothrix schenckii]KJR79874.1 hypothetical protein SPSK_11045 [Sporothrix schenckii 1099-18]BAK55698.1 hypothetical protein [Sporothrix schenckii]